MRFLTGEMGEANMWRPHIERLGLGRMFTRYLAPPYPGEPWGLDCGAYTCWTKGIEWDGEAYLRRVERASALPGCWLAVVPDRVADPSSLEFSLEWRERLAGFNLPWFLALQDGMMPEALTPHVGLFSGLFLGGTDAFKLTAGFWSEFAHTHGLRFHYARAGTAPKLRHALAVGADSADSTRILRDRAYWRQFERLWTMGDAQGGLFDDAECRSAVGRDGLGGPAGGAGGGRWRRGRDGSFV